MKVQGSKIKYLKVHKEFVKSSKSSGEANWSFSLYFSFILILVMSMGICAHVIYILIKWKECAKKDHIINMNEVKNDIFIP